MGIFVMACYRPKPNRTAELLIELEMHVKTLREQKLVTDRQPYLMRAKDGTFIEIFEWVSEAAIEQAHINPVVADMRRRFAQCCQYAKIGDLNEAQEFFSSFEPIDLEPVLT